MLTNRSAAVARSALRVRDLRLAYPGESGPVRALRGVDLDVPSGSFMAIMGPSGSGKTTLLNCAAGLRTPTGGTVELGGELVGGLGETQLAKLRRRRLGFVFQSFELLPVLSTQQNVELPLRLDARPVDTARTMALLERVGLGRRAGHRPDQLSGGQKQRIAIARALITEPEIVFADEPTGALDIRSAREVLKLLRELAGQGQTIIMVTHDPVAAAFADRVLFLADGVIAGEITSPDARDIAARMAVLVESAERSDSENRVR